MELKDRISKAWGVYKKSGLISNERNRLADRVYELPDCKGFFFDLEGYSPFPCAYYPKVVELTPVTVGFRPTPRKSIHTDTGFFQSYDDANPIQLKEYFYYVLCKDKKKMQEMLKKSETANTRAYCLTGIAENSSDLEKIADACRATITFTSFCLDFYALYECYEPLVKTNEPSLPFIEMRETANALMMPLTTDVFSAFFKGMIRLTDSYLYDSREKFMNKVENFLEKEGIILYADHIEDNKVFLQKVISLTQKYAEMYPNISAIHHALEDIKHQERLNRGNYWNARQKLESYYSDNPEMKITVKNLLELNTYALHFNDEARRRRAGLFKLISRPDLRELEEAIAKRIKEEDYVKAILEPFSNT